MDRKSGMLIVQTGYGVCVWDIEGQYLSDGEGFLSMEGRLNDPLIEAKMRDSAIYWIGEDIGRPLWLPDHRKISKDEWEDQKARLEDGKIPDEVDEVRQKLGLA